MKAINFVIIRYDADEGRVFDWKEPRYREELDELGKEIKVREHLFAKTLFIGPTDSIDNYIEVEEV